MNHIVLMGRLTRDPELRHTPNGIPVASFTLAVDRPYTSKESGERQTDFIDIVAWRSTAEFVVKYFTKGQMCALTGRLQIRDWTDKDGNKRRTAEVVADNVYFTESKKSREAAAGYSYPDARPSADSGYRPPVVGSGFEEFDDEDDNLPF
ncbi:MAG: single-stranded DNA-binding protein [Clostridiales bacterium]|nr:single-stranded DNA-binding protein [Clostridiales bacterium]